MADGVVKFAVDKLEEMAVQELKLQTEVGKKVLELRHELEWLRTFLRDADRKRRQPVEANELIEVWVRQTRELAHDAEDLLEEFFHRGELHCHGCFDLPSFVQWLRHSSAGLFTRHAIFDEIKDINKRIEEIKKQRKEYQLQKLSCVSKPHRRNYSDWSTLNERDIEEKLQDIWENRYHEDINKWLVDDEETRQTVIALTGKSGIGKTALASFFYGRGYVRKKFDCVIWVHVPHKFRFVDLLRDIIRQASGKLQQEQEQEQEKEQKQKQKQKQKAAVVARSGGIEEEHIKQDIAAELGDKKYLIVLDDVRSMEEWNFFMATLPAGKGNRVLVTTQLKIPEAMEGTRNGHGYCLRIKELGKLNTEQAKMLFCKRVYGNTNTEQAKMLFCKRVYGNTNTEETMGKLTKLDKLLQGESLPLNVVMLAGLLRSKREDEWDDVIENLAPSVESPDVDSASASEKQSQKKKPAAARFKKPTSTENILTVCMDDLPPHLKPCFLYFAGFTAEAAIDARRLVRLWVAEGFLQPRNGQTTEERGMECLKELISRCLVHLVETDAADNIVAVCVHQTVLDFAQEEARDTNFLHVHSTTAGLSRGGVRRVALRNTYDTYLSVVLSAPKLHSLLCDIPESAAKDDKNPAVDPLQSSAKKFWKRARGFVNGRVHTFSVNGSRFLRVMDLKGVEHRHTLPEEIGWLIHLRYLGLSHTTVMRLPKSVRKLRNLQTLDVSNTRVDAVPCKFWRIRTLRHVIAKKLLKGPKEHDPLTEVQELHGVPWGRWAQNGAAIKRMTNLRSLNAWNVPRAAAVGNALLPALAGLECLRSLDLEAADDAELPLQELLAMLSLRQLQYLRLKGKVGKVAETKLPLQGHQYLLPNLAKLELYLSRCSQGHIDMLARLPNLAELVLGEASYVDAHMVVPVGGFPGLRKLQLVDLEELTECTVAGDDTGALPQLRHVSVFQCGKLRKVLPSLPELSLLTCSQDTNLDHGQHKFLTGEKRADVVRSRNRMPSRRQLAA